MLLSTLLNLYVLRVSKFLVLLICALNALKRKDGCRILTCYVGIIAFVNPVSIIIIKEVRTGSEAMMVAQP